jgi:hypothetical protein
METPMFEYSTGRNWTIISLSTVTFTDYSHVDVAAVVAAVVDVVAAAAAVVGLSSVYSRPRPM